ncbi:hypothetical protein PCE1_002219 [Barthelona sp. PCE]
MSKNAELPLSLRPKTASKTTQRLIKQLENKHSTLIDSGNYRTAKNVKHEIQLIRENELHEMEREERSRQQVEHHRLNEAFRMRRERFDVEWVSEHDAIKEQNRKKLRELNEQHRREKEFFERELTKEFSQKRPKFSSKYLFMINQEKKLAQQGLFDQAQVVNHRRGILEAKEVEEFMRQIERSKERRRHKLADKQKKELQFLQEKLKRGLYDFVRHFEKSSKVLDRLENNQRKHMEHSHVMEFKAKPVPKKVLSSSSVRHSELTASKLGSLMFSKEISSTRTKPKPDRSMDEN